MKTRVLLKFHASGAKSAFVDGVSSAMSIRFTSDPAPPRVRKVSGGEADDVAHRMTDMKKYGRDVDHARQRVA